MQKVEFLMPYQRSLGLVGEIVAQEQGYFADEGIELEPIPTEGGSFVAQQLISGNAEYGMFGAQDVMVANSQGQPIYAIWEHDRDTITIQAPADGDVDSIDDLAGKAIGITDAGGGEVNLVNAVIENAGLSDQVETPVVGPGGPSVYQALKSGEIAAYSGFQSDMAGVEGAGIDLEPILPEEYTGITGQVLALSEEGMADEAARETAIKIARAWTRGNLWALEHPEETLEFACADYVPDECTDMAIAEAFIGATLSGVEPRGGGLMVGEFDYDSLKQQETLLSRKDLGPEPIDLEKAFTNDYIAEINEFDDPSAEDAGGDADEG